MKLWNVYFHIEVRRATNLILIENKNILVDFLGYINHHAAYFEKLRLNDITK